jgi:hypothetical protein
MVVGATGIRLNIKQAVTSELGVNQLAYTLLFVSFPEKEAPRPNNKT